MLCMMNERQAFGGGKGWQDRYANGLSHVLSPAGVAFLVMAVLALRGAGEGGVALGTALAGVFAFVLVPALVLLVQARSSDTRDVYAPAPTVRRRMLMAGTVCYLIGYVVSEFFSQSPGLHWSGATFCAAAAAVALMTPGHENRVYEITGPAVVRMRDVASIASEISGIQIEVIEAGPGDEVRAPRPSGTTLTTHFRDITGEPGTTARDLLEANRDVLLEARGGESR